MAAAVGTGLLVGVLTALVGIGGGTVMVPFLYLIYSRTPTSLQAQTVVAHATSLGVAFVASTIGTYRYARARAIVWRAALIYGIPGSLSAFAAARFVAASGEEEWIRGAFGGFLVVSAADMVRRALKGAELPESGTAGSGSSFLLGVMGIGSGLLAGFLGVGGGLLGVPALLYIGRLKVRDLAPTALAAVCLATLAGVIGYLTASGAPPVSPFMAGFVDLRMAAALTVGASLTVPLGVQLNRMAKPKVLYWVFASVLGLLGARLVWQAVYA